jgi:hypothetical protein
LRKIALPLHFAAKTPDSALGVSLSQKTQPGFDCGFLSPSAASSHSLGHQTIIDINIGSHL